MASPIPEAWIERRASPDSSLRRRSWRRGRLRIRHLEDTHRAQQVIVMVTTSASATTSTGSTTTIKPQMVTD
jgi:hypothetical protein